jgi:hypothetical protein
MFWSARATSSRTPAWGGICARRSSSSRRAKFRAPIRSASPRPGQPWIDFEWAFEATLGELYRAGRLGLVCAFCYAIFAATILGIYRTLLQSGFSLSVVLLTTGVAFLTLQIHFSARPVLFTYLFMALVVEVWRAARATAQARLADPAAGLCAWANLHAGWLAALLFLGSRFSGALLDRISKRVDGDEAPLIPWIGLTAPLHPGDIAQSVGLGLHRHIFLMATTYKSAALWDEYLPPEFRRRPACRPSRCCSSWRSFSLARVFKRAPLWRWEMVLPVLFFLYEGLKAQRHVMLLMEIAAVPVARDLEVLLHGNWWPFLRERLKGISGPATAGGRRCLARAGAALVLRRFLCGRRLRVNIHVGGSVTPKLVAFLRDHPRPLSPAADDDLERRPAPLEHAPRFPRQLRRPRRFLRR